MIEHEGGAIIDLDLEVVGSENKLTAVLATPPGGPVGINDRFILREAQGVMVRAKDHGRDPSGAPRAKLLEILLWWERAGQEIVDKKREDAIIFEVGDSARSEFSLAERTADGSLQPDLVLNLAREGIYILHWPNPKIQHHASFRFSVALEVDGRTAVWDPDVHDVGPRG